MASRYKNRQKITNNRSFYSEFFKERKVSLINQYITPKIPFMKTEDRGKINSIPHIWGIGDRYYKLASQHYDDPTYWWVIGWYNQRPLESDVTIGSVIYVPTPLDDVLTFFY